MGECSYQATPLAAHRACQHQLAWVIERTHIATSRICLATSRAANLAHALATTARPRPGAKGKDIPNRDGGGTHTPNASVTPNWRVGGLVLSMEDLRGAVKWSHYNPPDHYSSQWTWDGSFGDVATWEFGASGFAHTKDLGGLANLGNCSMRIGCAAKYPAKVKGYETGGNDFAFGTCLMADPSGRLARLVGWLARSIAWCWLD